MIHLPTLWVDTHSIINTSKLFLLLWLQHSLYDLPSLSVLVMLVIQHSLAVHPSAWWTAYSININTWRTPLCRGIFDQSSEWRLSLNLLKLCRYWREVKINDAVIILTANISHIWQHFAFSFNSSLSFFFPKSSQTRCRNRAWI